MIQQSNLRRHLRQTIFEALTQNGICVLSNASGGDNQKARQPVTKPTKAQTDSNVTKSRNINRWPCETETTTPAKTHGIPRRKPKRNACAGPFYNSAMNYSKNVFNTTPESSPAINVQPNENCDHFSEMLKTNIRHGTVSSIQTPCCSQ